MQKYLAPFFAISLAMTVEAQVAQYIPPALSSLGSLNPTRGAAGSTLVGAASIIPGNGGGYVVDVDYDGPGNVSASLSATELRVGITSTDVVGDYELRAITFVDTQGITVYKRDGAVDRLFYNTAGLSAAHTLNFSALDFSVVVPSAVPPTITAQPTSVQVTAGQSASFTVTVTSLTSATVQWRKNGVPIAGTTGGELTIPSTTIADAGTYDAIITNTAGSISSAAASLVVNSAPIASLAFVTSHPASLQVQAGQTATFTVSATSQSPMVVQWRKNGVPITGVAGPQLTIASATAADAGSYDAVITNDAGSISSSAAALTVDHGRVKNVSVRIVVSDNGVLICGFVVDTPKAVLIRGIGRGLEQFGVPGTMPNPRIEVYDSAGAVVAQNDDYTPTPLGNTTMARLGAFGMASAQDAALVVILPAGAYTVHLKPVGGIGGDCLLEVYDAD